MTIMASLWQEAVIPATREADAGGAPVRGHSIVLHDPVSMNTNSEALRVRLRGRAHLTGVRLWVRVPVCLKQKENENVGENVEKRRPLLDVPVKSN